MYEVDSDNGFGLSETYDSLKADKKYKNIKWDNSDKRYVVIKDCMNGPKIIDRDTSDYGIIMTSKGREIMMDNHIHLGDSYLQLIKEYFRL